MDEQHILRIPRSDDPENFVLINVRKTGKSALDLKLVATEGEDPYVGSSMLPAALHVPYSHRTKGRGDDDLTFRR